MSGSKSRAIYCWTTSVYEVCNVLEIRIVFSTVLFIDYTSAQSRLSTSTSVAFVSRHLLCLNITIPSHGSKFSSSLVSNASPSTVELFQQCLQYP